MLWARVMRGSSSRAKSGRPAGGDDLGRLRRAQRIAHADDDLPLAEPVEVVLAGLGIGPGRADLEDHVGGEDLGAGGDDLGALFGVLLVGEAGRLARRAFDQDLQPGLLEGSDGGRDQRHAVLAGEALSGYCDNHGSTDVRGRFAAQSVGRPVSFFLWASGRSDMARVTGGTGTGHGRFAEAQAGHAHSLRGMGPGPTGFGSALVALFWKRMVVKTPPDDGPCDRRKVSRLYAREGLPALKERVNYGFHIPRFETKATAQRRGVGSGGDGRAARGRRGGRSVVGSPLVPPVSARTSRPRTG